MTNLREHAAARAEASAALAPNTVRTLPLSQPHEIFFHLDFRRALEMHRRKVIAILLVTAVLSVFQVARRWNTYKAESQVYVQPAPHRVIENGPAQQWPYDANTYESYIQQQVHDVTRPDVLAAAVSRIPGWRGDSESEQAAADRLGSDIDVVREGTAYAVSITAKASSAEEAAQMANAVAAAYIESAKLQERAGDPQRIQLLREERDRIVKELAADRAEQEDLTRKLGMASTSGSSPNPIDDQITQTRAELVRARTDNDQAAAKLTALAGPRNSNAALDAEADALVAADPGLVSMKTALNKRRSDIISQMANLTPNHPLYKQDTEELSKINTSLDSMTRDLRAKASAEIQQRLKNDLERTSSVESRLNAQLAQLTGAAGTAAPRLQRSNELATDIQRLQNRFTLVDEQYRNLTMENNAPGAVYLASAALPPLHAERGRVLRNGFIVMLAGLMLALGTALLAYNLDPRIYVALDVERVLGLPPMALVPDLLEVGTGVAEEYMLRVAAAVEYAHQQGMLNSCIFTGVAGGAGTTTVSTRVSSLLEAMGRETVRVDAVGSAQPKRALPAGSDLVPARGSRSSALLQQMNEETGEDTVVVTDTAPLLVSGETEYLARFVDAAIVVVESGITTKAQLREVARTLQRLEVGSVGFVLNRISLANADPSFRESVQAVDAHLRAQTRAEVEPARTDPPASDEPVDSPVTDDGSSALHRLWNIISEPENAAKTPAAVSDAASSFAAPNPAASAATPDNSAASGQSVAGPEAGPNISQQGGLPEYPVRSTPPLSQSHIPADRPQEFAAPPRPQPQTGSQTGPQTAPQAAPQPARAESRRPAPSSISRPLRGREPIRPSAAEPQAHYVPPPAAPAQPHESAAAAQSDPNAAWAGAAQAAVLAPFGDGVEQPRPAGQTWNDFAWTDFPRNDFPRNDFAPVRNDLPPVQTPERVAAASAQDRTPATELPAQQPVLPQLSLVAAGPDAMALPVPAHDASYSTASRLGGLRTLMNSLGIRTTQRDAEPRSAYSEPEARPERPAERTVFAQPQTPAHLGKLGEKTPMAEVTARAEIIPPRAAIEQAEREKEQNRSTKAARVSRWEAVDDVETLPSMRGQYRKRR